MGKKEELSVVLRVQDFGSSRLKKFERQVGVTTRNARRKFMALKRSIVSVQSGLALLVGGALVRRSVQAWFKQEEAVAGLSAALDLLGEDAAKVTPEMEAFASELQEITTQGDEATLELMTLGATMGKFSGDTLKKATLAAMGLAKAFKMDVVAAMRLIAKAAAGDTASLKRYGIVIDNTLGKQEKLNQLLKIGAEKFHLVTAAAKTDAGQMKQAANDIGDLEEELGKAAVQLFKTEGGFKAVKGAVTFFKKEMGGVRGETAKTGTFFIDVFSNVATAVFEVGKSIHGAVTLANVLRSKVSGGIERTSQAKTDEMERARSEAVAILGTATGERKKAILAYMKVLDEAISTNSRFEHAQRKAGEEGEEAAIKSAKAYQKLDDTLQDLKESMEGISREDKGKGSTSKSKTLAELLAEGTAEAAETKKALEGVKKVQQEINKAAFDWGGLLKDVGDIVGSSLSSVWDDLIGKSINLNNIIQDILRQIGSKVFSAAVTSASTAIFSGGGAAVGSAAHGAVFSGGIKSLAKGGGLFSGDQIVRVGDNAEKKEVVMPMTRDSEGNLGVRGTGGGGQTNIYLSSLSPKTWAQFLHEPSNADALLGWTMNQNKKNPRSMGTA